jgi:predicted polyphosphate/ATP-dependent NAD kinase
VGHATVGIIANPASGRDVRRRLANAAPSTIADKVTIVRRVAIGAVRAGATRLVVLPDPFGLCRRAFSTVDLGVEIDEVAVPRTHDERESIAAAAALRDEGAGAVVVLGGDGTNRAVALGWPDAPVVPLSTGTNNAFPIHVEPTIAGAAAGLVASGGVELADVARPAKVVRVEVDGERDDLALIDALLTTERQVGSLKLFDARAMTLAVLARAEPAAVGVSSIGGLLLPCGADDDGGVLLRFAADASRIVSAAMAPGLYEDIGVEACSSLALGEVVETGGPAILALDGERQREVAGTIRLRVERDGPRVIDVWATMADAARRGLYVSEID